VLKCQVNEPNILPREIRPDALSWSYTMGGIEYVVTWCRTEREVDNNSWYHEMGGIAHIRGTAV